MSVGQLAMKHSAPTLMAVKRDGDKQKAQTLEVYGNPDSFAHLTTYSCKNDENSSAIG